MDSIARARYGACAARVVMTSDSTAPFSRPLTEARRVILHGPRERAPGFLERLGMTHTIVRTSLDARVGEPVLLRVPSTPFGELSLPTTLRWSADGAHALQLGTLRARDVAALNRMRGKVRDARFALRREGFRIDALLDPFATPRGPALPGAGRRVALVLRNGSLDAIAVRLSARSAIVLASIELPVGARVAIRVKSDTWVGELTLPALVRWTARGAHGLSYEQPRARDVWALHRLAA